MYTDITPPCIWRAREVYMAVTRPCTGRPRLCRRRPCNMSCTRPCIRPCNVLCARYKAAVYTAREHVLARENCPYTAVCGPCTRPVYANRVHDCVRTICTYLYGRLRPCTWRVHGPVDGTCTRPCPGRAHGRVDDRYTAAYTCLRVYVYKGRVRGRVRAIYTAENGRLHGHTRPCNVSCIQPRTGRIGSCTRQCTGRVHGRFRPSK